MERALSLSKKNSDKTGESQREIKQTIASDNPNDFVIDFTEENLIETFSTVLRPTMMIF